MITAGAGPLSQRIGVFGGAFDPPHNAHVALAQTAFKQLVLDRLLVVPTGQAWHKSRSLSEPAHRLAMARLAFGGLAGTSVDAREMHRPGPTFTIDTLETLQLENPAAQLYLIMGADQFAAFHEWHCWKAILQIAIICIADRAISTGAKAQFDAYPGYQSRFLTLPMPLMPVSATLIRHLVSSKPDGATSISSMVSPAVARYISLNQLYSSV